MSIAKVAVPFFAVTASLYWAFSAIGQKPLSPIIVPVVSRTQCVTPKRDLNEMVRDSAHAAGLDPALSHAIIRAESEGVIKALGPNPNQLKKKRIAAIDDMFLRLIAITDFGPMQLNGYEAMRLGLRPEQLCDPRETIELATYILKDCWNRVRAIGKHSRLEIAVSCYNVGLSEAMKLNRTGLNYAREVLRIYRGEEA